jgi:hypothetical protein
MFKIPPPRVICAPSNSMYNIVTFCPVLICDMRWTQGFTANAILFMELSPEELLSFHCDLSVKQIRSRIGHLFSIWIPIIISLMQEEDQVRPPPHPHWSLWAVPGTCLCQNFKAT